MSNTFHSPFKPNLELNRYPQHKKDLLQAWDSADELLLQHLHTLDLEGKRILILNDTFGALSCSLEGLDITTYTDSYLSDQGIRANSGSRIKPLNLLQALSGVYDWVVIRVPKNMSFFEDLLCHVSQHLHADSKIICGYMIKHQSKASFDLLNRIIGETSTSLAQKKARLIFSDFSRKPLHSPYPMPVSLGTLDASAEVTFKIPLLNNSNLFSREKLDIGTRFLLGHLPEGDFDTILDMGSANGIVGIAAQMLHPQAKVVFSDESQMAVQSTMSNYRAYFQREAECAWTHCYQTGADNSVDLVLCNPPFHQGNSVSDATAWQMFTDAHRVLRPGGTLRVIGNSHLQYPLALKKIFGNSERIAANPKFMIVDAVKAGA